MLTYLYLCQPHETDNILASILQMNWGREKLSEFPEITTASKRQSQDSTQANGSDFTLVLKTISMYLMEKGQKLSHQFDCSSLGISHNCRSKIWSIFFFLVVLLSFLRNSPCNKVGIFPLTFLWLEFVQLDYAYSISSTFHI